MGKADRRALNAQKYKKFSGNKSEGHGFANVRKKQVASKYHRVVTREKKNLGAWTEKLKKIYAEADTTLDDDPLQKFGKKKNKKNKKASNIVSPKESNASEGNDSKITSENAEVEASGKNRSSPQRDSSKSMKRPAKVSSFYREEKEWRRKQQEKQHRQQEIESKRQEREAAIAQHKRTKRHRHRMLAKCNYKGQPNLGSRVELLLEQIVAQRTPANT